MFVEQQRVFQSAAGKQSFRKSREEHGLERTASRFAVGLLGFTGLITVGAAALTLVAWRDLVLGDALSNLGGAIAGVVYAALGALIVQRVRNRIGWILLAEGLGLAFMSLLSAYSVIGLLTQPGSLPGPKLVGAIAEWIFIPLPTVLAFLLLLFPTGAVPSSRWRPIVPLGIAATALLLVAFVVTPRPVALPAPEGLSLTYPNPLAIQTPVLTTVPFGTVSALGVLSVALLAGAFTALVVRYRGGRGELRQQIKWVAFAAVVALVSQVVAVLGTAVCQCDQSPVATVAYIPFTLIVLFGIPAAIALAILKHGLYEIDVIINRAVVYGLLAAALTSVYVGIVAGVGAIAGRQGGAVLTVVAAAVVALLFQPLRQRAQLLANRLVYGERATPYQVLSDLAEGMAGTLGLDEVLDRMVSALADGTGATRVDVWIRVGRELRPVAAWPRGAPMPDARPLADGDELPSFEDATRAVAVRHGTELLGALALEKPRSEALSLTEDRLLQDLASQAGLVLRNVRLTTELQATIGELRASRRRLVEAQDAERRKLERNLHDGAQQQLVALRVHLGLLERLAEDPERVKQLARQLQEALQGALDDLARGIFPPLLADKGLAAALEAQGRKAAVAATVESDGVTRYPQEVEAAVYFCTLEAMQNAAKHSGASSLTVRVAQKADHLVFEVQDDGDGFDPGSAGYGSGLRGMADRIDAVGGRLEVSSSPGHGTLVRGSIELPGGT